MAKNPKRNEARERADNTAKAQHSDPTAKGRVRSDKKRVSAGTAHESKRAVKSGAASSRQAGSRAGRPGAAPEIGTRYENRVAAWVAVQILADEGERAFGMRDRPVSLLRQIPQPVDDVLVEDAGNGVAFVQAKNNLGLSPKATSVLASVIDQFAAQYVGKKALKIVGEYPWERPLDTSRDRFVLATSAKSPDTISVHLMKALERSRKGVPTPPANKREAAAQHVLLNHTRRSLLKHLGRQPSTAETKEFLSLIRVVVLDVYEATSKDAKDAQNILARSVLVNPRERRKAWPVLADYCGAIAGDSSGVTRADLREYLMGEGFELRVPASYEQDTERLKSNSEMVADLLAERASIRVAANDIHIDRNFASVLQNEAEQGSLILVGEPGAGKSGALVSLYRALGRQRRDVVLLSAEHMEVPSIASLSVELHTEHPVLEVFSAWKTSRPGFLLIDGLDSVRGGRSVGTLRDLIKLISIKAPHWRVVISIREFDLRHGLELQELFAGAPVPGFRHDDFPEVRHLKVGRLSDEEFGQIQARASVLYSVVRSGTPELRELARVPFNLWLVSQLLKSGVPTDQIAPLQTQFELLERFWERRVVEECGRDAENVIRLICRRLFDPNGLVVTRAETAATSGSSQLDRLLSSGVLSETPHTGIIVFSHRVLFDYSAERLLFRASPGVVSEIKTNPDLAIRARPSLTIHFQHLWRLDAGGRTQFWQMVFSFELDSAVPAVAKVVGPAVALELATRPNDLEALHQAIEAGDQFAGQTFNRMVGGLMNAGPAFRPGQFTMWCNAAERVTRNLPTSQFHSVALLLSLLTQNDQLSGENSCLVGMAARAFLRFAIASPLSNAALMRHGIDAVCRTFSTDPSASREVLGLLLKQGRLEQHGYEDLPSLAHNVRLLVAHDAGFVGQVYLAAFALQESREDQVPIRRSQIFDMTTTPKQDADMARYVLAHDFIAFLNADPVVALHVVLDIAADDSTRPAWGDRELPPGEIAHFEFDGVQSGMRTDVHGMYWSASFNDNLDSMISAVFAFVEELATKPNGEAQLAEILRVFAAHNTLPVLWARLLKAAAAHPTNLGRMLSGLTTAVPFVQNIAVTHELGEYLRVMYPVLSEAERSATEAALISLPDRGARSQAKVNRHLRNQLLGYLPEGLLASSAAQNAVKRLRSRGGAPANEPLVPRVTGGFGRWPEEPKEDDPLLAKIGQLKDQILSFNQTHLNSNPSLEQSNKVFPELLELDDLVRGLPVEAGLPVTVKYAHNAVVSACAVIARAPDLHCSHPLGKFVMKVLLGASRHPEPRYDADREKALNRRFTASSFGPRVDAAGGLAWLATKRGCCRPQLFSTLSKLSKDKVPDVRRAVAADVFRLYDNNRRLMWKLLGSFCKEDRSTGVVRAAIDYSMNRLSGVARDEVAVLAQTVLNRIKSGDGARDVRAGSLHILAGLYIWRNHPLSGRIVLAVADATGKSPADAHNLVTPTSEALTHGADNDLAAGRVRERAFSLLLRIVSPIQAAVDKIFEDQSRSPSDAERETVSEMFAVLRSIALQIHLSSGAFRGGGRDATGEAKMRFYREATGVIEAVGKVGLPAASHYILETLETFVGSDPKEVFLLVGRITLAGRRFGYQGESQAAELIVRLVERYISDYPSLLATDRSCREMLRGVLDTFVDAGWPAAARLTFQLDRIFS